MEEKILIKSEKYNVKKLFKIFSLVGVAITLIMVIMVIVGFVGDMTEEIQVYNQHTHIVDDCVNSYRYRDEVRNRWYEYNVAQDVPYGYDEDDYVNDYIFCNGENKYMLTPECPKFYPNAFSYAIEEWWEDSAEVDSWLICLIPMLVLTAVGAIIYLWLNAYKLTVSDKRVSGEVLFGKKVDLPIDSVSATSIVSLFKGVGVSTSSGKINFLAIKNAKEVYEVINNLLIKRQEETAQNVGANIVQNINEADMLKQYKDLLDSGVITQEEFDAKKKQLLGL